MPGPKSADSKSWFLPSLLLAWSLNSQQLIIHYSWHPVFFFFLFALFVITCFGAFLLGIFLTRILRIPSICLLKSFYRDGKCFSNYFLNYDFKATYLPYSSRDSCYAEFGYSWSIFRAFTFFPLENGELFVKICCFDMESVICSLALGFLGVFIILFSTHSMALNLDLCPWFLLTSSWGTCQFVWLLCLCV